MKNFILALCIFLLTTVAVNAETFVVTNGDADGAGSFNAAVEMANNAPTDDVIVFVDPVLDVYRGGIVIADNGTLTIEGRGADVMRIRLFNADIPIIEIADDATVIINNITLSNGRRAIYQRPGASLTINDSILRNNGVGSDENASGGAIISFSGYLEINNSLITQNAARGGLNNLSGEMPENSPEGSSVGSGGAIYAGGTLVVNDSVFTENECNGSGGAISVFGTATIRRSIFTDNETVYSGGAIRGGRINMSDSLVANNYGYRGGGISTEVGFILNTTISGNSARYGGGLRNASSSFSNGVTLRNVTITNNTALLEGGGLAPLIDETLYLGNTIVAGNNSPDGKDIKGVIVSSGYNIIGNTSGVTVTGDQTGDRLNTDPLLAPLADNGGDSLTHALLPGSPAINNGNNPLAVDFANNPLQFDQRGEPFLRIVGGRVDIGAFELQTATNIPTKTLFDFDGDGRADKVVFRPSDGNWYQLLSDVGIITTNFGAPTDKLVPADYDADGKTDIAVFRDGFWYILKSTTGGFFAVQFGQAGDVPVPADYDADGQDDIAVYREGFWYILNSSDGSFRGERFGQTGDELIIGDFDADGRSDLAVYRSGFWYIQQSQNGFRAENFGAPTDIPVAADYDGDGKTDIAVYRDGYWYLLNSSTGFSAVQFGNATDKPVPADYDGDGKTDAAVYRGGYWYVLGTTNGINAVQWGASDDIPAPNAFIEQ